MIKKAISSGANAIVGLRFDRSAQIANASEVLAYGTAVKIKKEDPKSKTLVEYGADVRRIAGLRQCMREGRMVADQGDACDQGKYDAAALLRWALTAESKAEKAKPKAVQTKVCFEAIPLTEYLSDASTRRRYL